MRVTINRDRCSGHGRCYSLAPALFDVDDDGYGFVRGGGEVAEELREAAAAGVRNCPERAVVIDE